MDDALPRVLEREVRQRAGVADVGVERLHLQTRHRILDALVPMVGGSVVVGVGDDGVRPPRLATGELQALEGLRTGDFMHEMAVDVDERGAVRLLAHDVTRP